MKTNKKKLGNPLSARRNFPVDLTWRMVFLPAVFARIVKVRDFAQVINFRKKAHWKIHPHKVDKYNRESMKLILFFVFCFFQ